ncbi:MAG: M23 family metallopeptidase, partial [Bacteroidetes bacterium]|nr:M23 family metallopeptidase [Bacteroidota bacterium]
MQKLLFFISLIFLFFQPLSAQTVYPQNDFRSPVDATLTLAGNFGEIRPNHFHAGFDIRTNNKEGMPIYAVADGYISRIKISAYGYGKAIYISHPNGYTSVYGHLKSFNNDIQDFTSKIQSLKESFEIDTFLLASSLPVKKGALIALSGNTGGSQGPHLHFEIRDSKTEMPINPYYFGYLIADTVKPRVTQLAIYPIGANSSVNGKNISKKIAPVYEKGKYSFLKQDTISIHGEVGFGIECYDTETKSTNKNGVFSIELQSGGKKVFYYEMEKFTFENARYVNAHIDYASKKQHNTTIQKCFLSKNNQVGIYKNVLNNGVLNFSGDSIHWIRFIVKDFAGNTTELMLKVRGNSSKHDGFSSKPKPAVFDCAKENQFSTEEIKVIIPPLALYDDVLFKYSKSASVKGTFSPLHQILTSNIALQKNISLSIKSVRLPDQLKTKACIISVDEKGRKHYKGGSYLDGWVTTQTKE